MNTLIICGIILAVYLVYSFAISKLLRKVNKKWYLGFIPVVNFIELLELAEYKWYNILKFIIPLGIIAICYFGGFKEQLIYLIEGFSALCLVWYTAMLKYRLSKKFGKGILFTILFILIPVIPFVLLGFDKSNYDYKLEFTSSKLKFLTVFLTVFSLVASFTILIPTVFDNITKGLDLAGGFEILYKVSPAEKDVKLTESMVEDTYRTMLRRIDTLGVSEPEITIEGKDKIRVKLAGISDVDTARSYITLAGELTFRDSSDKKLMGKEVLSGSMAAKVSQDSNGRPAVSLSIKDNDTFYNVTSEISKTSDQLIVIWLDYNPETDSYKTANCGQFDNLVEAKCLSAATVSQGFSSDVIIQGNFTEEQVQNLVDLINSGSNNVKFKEISSQTVGSAFGENSLDKTKIAGVIGIACIIAFMILIYNFEGFISSSVILVYAFFTFLIYYLIDGVLTLPGIAALVLGVGMAVDANVITAERIKEELRKGKPLKEAYKNGVKNSFSSILDSNVTTFIVAVILFIFGTSSVKGFATMLMINIAMTMLIVVLVTRLITYVFINTGFFNNRLKLFINQSKKEIVKSTERVDSRFEKKIKFDFAKNFKKLIIIPAIILLVGVGFAIFKGFNFGIDFTGGTDITVTSQKASLKKINKTVSDLGYTVIESSESDDNYYIKVSEILTDDAVTDTKNAISEKYDASVDISVVSNLVKKDLIKNAIKALLIALVGIILYITIRYKFSYALAAIMALLHDSVMVIMLFSIFRIEINSIFVAAILTIIGYSINNTIVIFDRLRENIKKHYMSKEFDEVKLKEIANASIKETIFRSINTTITTLLPIICLIVFGSREIIEFNIAIVIGLIVGLFSSVFLSCSFMIIIERMINKSKKKQAKKAPKKENKKETKRKVQELSVKGINA
ncbi:MAG: protein translocase subunit SecD [Bacilli bacterium]|nr:protein translocase subunit SecD [Bacilli bacterium]